MGRRDKSGRRPAGADATADAAVGLQFVDCRDRFSGAVQDASIAREPASLPPTYSRLRGGSYHPDRLRHDRDERADDAETTRAHKDIKGRTRRSRLVDKLFYGTAVTNSPPPTTTTRVFSPDVGYITVYDNDPAGYTSARGDRNDGYFVAVPQGGAVCVTKRDGNAQLRSHWPTSTIIHIA